MKKFLLVVAITLATQLAFAQEIKIGLKAGVNFANQVYTVEGISISPSSVTSFHFHGLVDVPLSPVFSIQPGIGISGKGVEVEGDENFGAGKIDIMYLDIPVNAVAKFPIPALGKVFIGAGPYAGIGLSGKGKANGESEDVEFGDDGDFKRGDLGVNFLGGLELNQGIMFNVNYGLGLANVTPSIDEIDVKTKNRVFTISVGFLF